MREGQECSILRYTLSYRRLDAAKWSYIRQVDGDDDPGSVESNFSARRHKID